MPLMAFRCQSENLILRRVKMLCLIGRDNPLTFFDHRVRRSLASPREPIAFRRIRNACSNALSIGSFEAKPVSTSSHDALE